jgi:hypothetical protein
MILYGTYLTISVKNSLYSEVARFKNDLTAVDYLNKVVLIVL